MEDNPYMPQRHWLADIDIAGRQARVRTKGATNEGHSTASLFVILASAGIAQLAAADPRDNHHFVRHDEWKKGAKIHDEDWQRGERVDYRQSHLRAPPHGYEWRMIDGNYVLAAVATGVIASVVAADIAAH